MREAVDAGPGDAGPGDAGPSCVGLGDLCASTASCCSGLTCDVSELVQTCQLPPPDGGVCRTEGQTCDQTGSAATCCGVLFCDANPDGGSTVCRAIIIQ